MNTLEAWHNVVKSNHSNSDDSITAGYCGIPGSFGESALVRYFGALQKPIRNYPTFPMVCDAIVMEEIRYGILPVENTTTGGIKEVYDLIRMKDLYIVGEICLPIVHNLIGLPGTIPEHVKEIFSHPQGLEQCEMYLSGLKSARRIPMNNTAVGVRHVAEQKNPAFAAIGGERAAKLYGLEILMPSIQNSIINRTRFVILSKNKEVHADADSSSVVLTTQHAIGALYDILGCFAKERVNLCRIESRPVPDHPWEYFIFLDLEGSIAHENVQRALAGVQTQCAYFKFLGSYQKGALV